MRCLGCARFTIWALKYIICPKKYYGTLTYSDGICTDQLPNLNDELGNRFVTEDCNSI